MKPTISNCYKCGEEVTISPTSGGKGSRDLTSYGAFCKCGLFEDHFGSDGTMRTAIREWNKFCKEQIE